MEKKEEKKPVIFNPCKYCLKRPVCKRQCDDLKNHIETQEILCVMSLFFIITGLSIFGIIYIFLNYSSIISYTIIALVLGVAYGFTIKELIAEYSEEYKEYIFLKKFFVILFGPTSIATAWLFYNFDWDDKLNTYSRRYFSKGLK